MITGLLKALLLRIFPISFLLLIFPLFALISDLSHAQQPSITSDGTLGTNVSLNQSNYTISEGTIRGGNQFHSFGRFNVLEGESAAFTGPNSINNIIGRVTGGGESFINGLLSSEINGANLYLLNPSGVMFGPNAQLDLSGSFHVSTADYLRLGENGIFYAALSDNGVLTMDPPSAFGFLNGNPVGISINESELEVSDGEILSVVGGGISIEGGWLSAPSGQVNIASVASNGEVLFDNDGLRVDSIEKFGNIRMAESTEIDASGEGGGTIYIRGGKLVVADSSLGAETWGEVDGKGIAIGVTDSVSISGGSISTATEGEGDAGDISLELSNLELTNGSRINSSSYGAGNGGDIIITAIDSFMMQASGMRSGTSTESSGNAGELSIKTDTLNVKAGALISTSTFGSGKGGNIDLDAKHILLTPIDAEGSDTGLLTGIFAEGVNGGDGGFLKITSQDLEILDGARISTITYGSGTAGSIDVNADNILLSGRNLTQGWASGIFTGSASNTTGKAGDLFIKTDTLDVKAGALISTRTYGSGKGGNIDLDAKNIWLTPVDAEGIDTGLYTGIVVNGINGGDSGNIDVTSDTIKIEDGARISAETSVFGKGGNINLAAKDIQLTGYYTDGFYTNRESGIFAGGVGDGGSITIKSENLEILDGASISSSTFFADTGGSIDITSDTIKIETNGSINTDAWFSGKGGNINLKAKYIRLTPVDAEGSHTGQSTTGIWAQGRFGADGGSITIESENLEILDGASISSTTLDSGKGGNIDVIAGRVIISGENHHLDWPSQIRASSEGTGTDSGNAGIIKITADYLLVEKKGLISTETLGFGEGGEIGIDVNRLSLDSKGQISSSTTGTGNGGKIRISATQFQQKGDAEVTATSSGGGKAGDIHISSKDEFLLQDSAILVEATQSDGGNIKINNDHMVMLINSEISASVGGGPDTVGGNISIDPEFVILQDSKIIANAYEGTGGNIEIVTDVFLADSDSKIDASSDQGIDGTVDIRATFSYLSENPAPMAEDFRSAVELLREPCLARMQGGKYNSLVVSGREVFPVGPGGLLPSPAYAR